MSSGQSAVASLSSITNENKPNKKTTNKDKDKTMTSTKSIKPKSNTIEAAREIILAAKDNEWRWSCKKCFKTNIKVNICPCGKTWACMEGFSHLKDETMCTGCKDTSPYFLRELGLPSDVHKELADLKTAKYESNECRCINFAWSHAKTDGCFSNEKTSLVSAFSKRGLCGLCANAIQSKDKHCTKCSGMWLCQCGKQFTLETRTCAVCKEYLNGDVLSCLRSRNDKYKSG